MKWSRDRRYGMFLVRNGLRHIRKLILFVHKKKKSERKRSEKKFPLLTDTNQDQ